MYGIMRYLTIADVCVLGTTSSTTALCAVDCVLSIHRARKSTPHWRLVYPLYLRAMYAADAGASPTLQRLPFISYLSRACRGCGTRTQRRVFGTLLCSGCTRNNRLTNAWMVPARVAVKLGAYHIPFHSGPRGPLVLAAHITQATGATRKRIHRAI